jgi:phage terminase small subunit
MEKPEQARARKLYQESGGKLLLKDIAAQLGVAEGTLRSWKNRYGWDGKSATLQTSATQRKRRAATNRKAAETITKNPGLKDHEKDFCAAFVHAPSASQAAMLTGRYKTYGSARQEACMMMKNPAVRAEITRLKEAKRAMLMADGDDIVEMHMRIAFADMSAFVEWGREEVQIMTPFGPLELPDSETGEKKPVTKEINSVRFREHDQVDGSLVQQVKIGRDGASIKLVDRQKSLDFLERYFLLNPMDKHKQDYDNKRLALEERTVKVHEDKAHGMTADIETIREELKGLMDIIRSPVPDRRLPDE